MTDPGRSSRRRSTASAAFALVLLTLVAAPVVGAVAPAGSGTGGPGDVGSGVPFAQSDSTNPCVGTITDEPSTTTLVSVQGARAGSKTASLLFGVAPNGSVVGVHNDTAAGRFWLYDVDPLPNGDLLVATTEPGITVVERVDPATGEHETVRRLENVEDAHDVDYLGDGEFATVDKGDGRNRVVIYDESGEFVWQWRFDNHTDRFPESGGGPYGDDWTHVNDVDQIGEDTLMVSVRNFDQVIAIDRDTKDVLWTLGEDDDYDVLNEQHNPDFIEGENGTATVLVADSENDRVAEYARVDGDWERTWVLRGGGLDEPRDADRLPNGNTLVTDRQGHRVLEVTPRGEVVWEFYTPWQPYDAERVGTDRGSDGPTMRTIRAEGTHEMTGSAGYDTARIERCYDYLTGYEGSRLVPDDELWGTGGPLSDTETAGSNGTADGESAGDGSTGAGSADWTTVPPDSSVVDGDGFGPLVALAAALIAAALIAAALIAGRRGRE